MDYAKAIREVEAKLKRQQEAIEGTKQLLDAIKEAAKQPNKK